MKNVRSHFLHPPSFLLHQPQNIASISSTSSSYFFLQPAPPPPYHHYTTYHNNNNSRLFIHTKLNYLPGTELHVTPQVQPKDAEHLRVSISVGAARRLRVLGAYVVCAGRVLAESRSGSSFGFRVSFVWRTITGVALLQNRFFFVMKSLGSV